MKLAFDWSILGAVADGKEVMEATFEDVSGCAEVLVILKEEGPGVLDTFIVHHLLLLLNSKSSPRKSSIGSVHHNKKYKL